MMTMITVDGDDGYDHGNNSDADGDDTNRNVQSDLGYRDWHLSRYKLLKKSLETRV